MFFLRRLWTTGLRMRLLSRDLLATPGLEKYALGVQKPIRIIVKMGRVTLGRRCRQRDGQEPGGRGVLQCSGNFFRLTNNLQVVPSK